MQRTAGAGIIEAIERNDLRLLERLLFVHDSSSASGSSGSEHRSEMPLDDQGHTAAHWAAAMGRVEVLEMLLSNGAQVNVLSHAGETPLHRAIMWPSCFELRNFERVLHLLKPNLSVVSRDVQGTYTPVEKIPLYLAGTERMPVTAAEYYLEIVLTEWMDQRIKLDLNARDKYGYTLLMKAAKNGSRHIVDLLLQVGADPSIRNFQNQTALDLTSSNAIRRLLPGGEERIVLAPSSSTLSELRGPYASKRMSHRRKTASTTTMTTTAASTHYYPSSRIPADMREQLLGDFERYLEQTAKTLTQHAERLAAKDESKTMVTAHLGLELVTSLLNLPVTDGTDQLLVNTRRIILENDSVPEVHSFLQWLRHASL